MSAGGKCYRQLGPHGLGDQADRWGRWFDRVRAIAIDLRHSAAIRTDSSLCAWGESFDIAPRRLHEAIVAVAVGNTARIQAVLDDRIIFDETPHGASDPMQRTADAVQVALPQPDAADSLGHPGTTAPAGVRERQQGRFLAANSEYVAANQAGVAPLYAELQGFFNLTPPSVNAVLVQFERCSFIPRVFGKARAIEVRGTAAQLPPLERTLKFRPQSGPRPLRAISGLQRHVPGHGGMPPRLGVSGSGCVTCWRKAARSCCWRRRGWVWPAQCWIQSRRANSCRQSGSPATLAQEGRSVQALVKFRDWPGRAPLGPPGPMSACGLRTHTSR